MQKNFSKQQAKQLGFKKVFISKIIGAAELIHNLEKLIKEQPKNKRLKEQLECFQSFPLSSQYVLNNMSAVGFSEVIALSARKQWNSETDTYDLIPLTKSDLEEIQREYTQRIQMKLEGRIELKLQQRYDY